MDSNREFSIDKIKKPKKIPPTLIIILSNVKNKLKINEICSHSQMKKRADNILVRMRES